MVRDAKRWTVDPGRSCLRLVCGGSIAAVFMGPAMARAQEGRGPVFQLQPGFTTTDFVSAPEGLASSTGFSLRFATRFPTQHAWLTPVIGATFLPYGSSGSGLRDTDAPTLFVGNIFSIVSAKRTGGWLTIELPMLLTHAPGASETGNVRDYGRDLVVEATAYVHLGAQVFREFGAAWSRFDLFASVGQTLTPNRDPVSGQRDRYNPASVVGASLNLGRTSP